MSSELEIGRLEIDGLALARGPRVLFQSLSLSVAAGEAVALHGPNGAGKTSLLRAVAGFIRPLAGRVAFFGPPTGPGGGQAEVEAEAARRRGCHLVGHQDGLESTRTARHELLFQARWAGGDETGALAAAERLGVAALLHLEVRLLSAGQRRRLALCRLVAARRPLWLLDEALGPLDGASRAAFGAVMDEHLAAGGLILAAAHGPLPTSSRTVEIAPMSVPA